MTGTAETFEFKSEARQLLNLMINSVYSTRDVFLRELISNSSDALDKLRFQGLTDSSLLSGAGELEIRVETDAEARTLTIADNGIGMSRDEVVANLGTIARSGTREFIEQSAEAEGKDTLDALIGQFGVGFYSAFMAAEEVRVITRRAGEEGATLWISKGDGSYSVQDDAREHSGTTVMLYLRSADPENDLADFTDNYVLQRTIKRYSDFVTYPIRLRTEEEKPAVDEEGEAIEGGEATKEITWPTINSMKAIWMRPDSEVEDEDYTEFYRHVSGDWGEPMHRVGFHAEGMFEYHALLFVPERTPFDLFYRDVKYGLQLYVNRVMIMDRCEELLPGYLRFVRGVVDSPDLSLNVSRELLQQDRRVAQIRKRVVKKLLDSFGELLAEDRDKYLTFWSSFGAALKEGVPNDPENQEKLNTLLMFQSTHDEEAFTTLDEYVERMKEGQDTIYYIAGESLEVVSKSPHLEAFRAKGYEVLYMTDPVDEVVGAALTEFKEKKFLSVGKGTADLGTEEERKSADEAREEKQKAHTSLFEALQGALDEHIKEVRLSNRLTTSAVCLVGDEHDLSPQLLRMLETAGQAPPKPKRIMELNPEHPVLAKLQVIHGAASDDPRIADYAQLLHCQALLAEGSPIPDPAGFTNLVADLMVRAVDSGAGAAKPKKAAKKSKKAEKESPEKDEASA